MSDENVTRTDDTERSGVIVYDPRGEPHRITLMDENDEYLELVEKPEQGVYAYENGETSITLFVEEP